MSRRIPEPEHCEQCPGQRGLVIDSRWSVFGYRRRRYKCPKCGNRWSSYETRMVPKQLRTAYYHNL